MIEFSQWVTTDRCELQHRQLPVTEFIDLLVEKLSNLTTHSYISHSQAQFLRDLKLKLDKDDVIVLGDFAENFKFVIQDEIQSYHWNQQQCTMHPLVIYYKVEEELCHQSLCFISDDLTHDVSMVYQIIKLSINFIKENVNPNIKTIHYFSDGCAGQYKNCKNFLNLCHHFTNFSVHCTWSFFATSHSKSPCDGLGGTVKCLTAAHRLQSPSHDQVINATQVYDFCRNSIERIKFYYISQSDMEIVRPPFRTEYESSSYITGNKKFPLLSTNIIKYYWGKTCF